VFLDGARVGVDLRGRVGDRGGGGTLVHVGHQDGLGERGLVVEAAASLAVATRTDLGG
jgi:hypothetical protein